MKKLTRKEFINYTSIYSTVLMISNGFPSIIGKEKTLVHSGVKIRNPREGEDIFTFIMRKMGKMDYNLYRQIIGSANPFKEADESLGIAAHDEDSRLNARYLISNTTVAKIDSNHVFNDEILQLILETTDQYKKSLLDDWSIAELKEFILNKPEQEIKEIMPGLSSDVIACVVKLMNNEELIHTGKKVFNPLPGSKIGSPGYLSARIQPNSPTDNLDDITWQVFCAWSYGVGDLVLGTNPVSSEIESVAKIETALHDIILTFGLEDVIPHCVLSHIDVQAAVEDIQPGTTGIWFQSLAGTTAANHTFDVSKEKMLGYAAMRRGQYGLYAETGQGADFTNGHGEGFDMVVHESRKYGFLRALKMNIPKPRDTWVHVNDVAGFIGPEVFKTKEQLVRTCLEDTVMGKLHGLTIGLDICSTLHMDVSLDDLDWCIDQIMPANPAYLMALPTKNDPMLSYLTTAFNDHVRIREKFNYKVNDAMWSFFKRLNVIDNQGKTTSHFGDPVWIYYKYRKAKGDQRSEKEIYKEGKEKIEEIRNRGVPIAVGFGENIWDLEPKLDARVRELYEDAKVSILMEMTKEFISAIPNSTPIKTTSADRKDYVYHPGSGEILDSRAIKTLRNLLQEWEEDDPNVQIIISDGLNIRALTDPGHLFPYLATLRNELEGRGFKVSDQNIVITYGRVRAGYQCGEWLFGQSSESNTAKGIIHIIGERPGSGHHNFSAYLSVASPRTWSQPGTVDHNISKVVSGISDTALKPVDAVEDTIRIFSNMFENYM